MHRTPAATVIAPSHHRCNSLPHRTSKDLHSHKEQNINLVSGTGSVGMVEAITVAGLPGVGYLPNSSHVEWE